jgi:hypothetical protein
MQPSPETAEMWVLLWSHSQNCTHVEPLARMLDANRLAYANNSPMDYVPLFVGRQEDAFAMSSSLRQTLHKREAERSPALTNFMQQVLHPGGHA